jgi:hypothetical protein
VAGAVRTQDPLFLTTVDVEVGDPQAQINRIVSGRTFSNSRLHRDLLGYLAAKTVAGEAGALKEYTVGIELFGKPESYDPRQESVVRVHVGRLRQRLIDYYRAEGLDDPLVVDLPRGGYSLTFTPRLAPSPVVQESAARSVEVEASTRGWWLLSRREIVLIALLLAGAIAYYLRSAPATLQLAAASAGLDGWSPALQALWSPILTPDRPLMVTLATGISDGTDGGTANAGFILGQFFGERKHNVFPIKSAALSIGELTMADIVFVGPPAAKPNLQGLAPMDAPFILTSDGVRNVRPAAGEAAFLPEVDPHDGRVGGRRSRSLAVITSRPGLNGNGSIVQFEGNQGSAVVGAVQAMTDSDLAKRFVDALKRPDGSLPRFYQVVLVVHAADDTPVEVTIQWQRALSVEHLADTAAGR